MINYPNQDSLYIENEEIEKVEHYKYLGYLKETTKEEIKCRIRWVDMSLRRQAPWKPFIRPHGEEDVKFENKR